MIVCVVISYRVSLHLCAHFPNVYQIAELVQTDIEVPVLVCSINTLFHVIYIVQTKFRYETSIELNDRSNDGLTNSY